MLKQWRLLRHIVPPLPKSNQQHRFLSSNRPFREGDILLLHPTTSRFASPVLTTPLSPGKKIESHHGVLYHDDLIGKSVRDVVTPVPGKKTYGRGLWRRRREAGKGGGEFRLHEVKLEEYVRLSRRIVTPVYPADAGLIVELLDLHPSDGQEEEESPRLEILEAGTGHGALTLYLSRAIHGANPPLPPSSRGIQTGTSQPYILEEREREEQLLSTWKLSRKAVVHSVDISPTYSAHAQKVVKNFRHGLYYHNIDFHVGDVGTWVGDRLPPAAKFNSSEHAPPNPNSNSNSNFNLFSFPNPNPDPPLTSSQPHSDTDPFLSHALLDLPNAPTHLPLISQALRVDGTLVVFNPSITQITECVSKIREQKIPLELEKVLELPLNGGAGGREWDVRAVRPRAVVAAEEKMREEGSSLSDEEERSVGGVTAEENEEKGEGGDTSTIYNPDFSSEESSSSSPVSPVESGEMEAEGIDLSISIGEFLRTSEDSSSSPAESGEDGREEEAAVSSTASSDTTRGEGWAMVCRPKVGDRIVGGGFLGVWKKKKRI